MARRRCSPDMLPLQPVAPWTGRLGMLTADGAYDAEVCALDAEDRPEPSTPCATAPLPSF